MGEGGCTGRDREKRAQEGEGAELGDDGVEEGGVGYWLNDRCPENVNFGCSGRSWVQRNYEPAVILEFSRW